MRYLTGIVVAGLISLAASAYRPGTASAGTPLLGLYEGASCDIASQNAAARNMLGRREDLDILFIDYTQTPEFAVSNVDWALGCYKGQAPNVALSVPLAFTKPSGGDHDFAEGAYTLADVAAGRLDAFFVHVARSAVDHGFSAAQMRLGWEMNGNWYRWSAAGRIGTFNTAFCHVRSVMQAAAPQARFVYWLNPTTNGDVAGEYPSCMSQPNSGVAWDQYENYWTTHASLAEPAAWRAAFASWWGISSLSSWHGEDRHAAPEFGVGIQAAADARDTGDDPTFMADLIAYDTAHGVEFMGLWDSNASYPGRLSDGSHPGEALEVMKTWGGGHLPSLLKGANLYRGAFSASIAGCRNVLAQLSDGRVALVAWAPGVSAVRGVLRVSQPRSVIAYDVGAGQVEVASRVAETGRSWTVRPGSPTVLLFS